MSSQLDIKEKNIRELAKILSYGSFRSSDIENIDFTNRCQVLANNLVNDFNKMFENYKKKIEIESGDYSIKKFD